MFDFWDSELTDEEAERLINRVAEEIQKRKLEVPAVMALEMHKPLAGVLGQGSVVFAPFFVPFMGFQAANDYTRLLAKRENYEKLMQKLEQPC
jgi:hypothetical protein